MMKNRVTVAMGAAIALAAAGACLAASTAAKAKNNTVTQNRESAVTTNENGCVSRTFTECTVTTNGNMVTEHRRETRTNMDTAGNVLETSTSEYAQSYPVGDTSVAPLPTAADTAAAAANADSFLGLKFGDVFKGSDKDFVTDDDEPSLLRATFTPKKKLAGFDDFYVYVTPTTHKVAKIFACAKEAVDPDANGRRHYLVQALEKKYGTWARLCSYWRPWYAFDLGSGRHVRAYLAGATDSYETLIAAWDDNVRATGAEEAEARREAALKEAAEQRDRRARDAAEAF